MVLHVTQQQANDLLLLIAVAETLTLPVLVKSAQLSREEAIGIADRMRPLDTYLMQLILDSLVENN